ncbi:hypothetical protein [Nonomuraea angiospora]
METDTATGARERLDLLRAELERRGWRADHRGTEERPFLHVRNPVDPGFHDSVACRNDRFCWNYGPEIGMVDDVAAVVDRIMHVLRVVA